MILTDIYEETSKHVYLNNDMLMVICVKFHHGRPSASIKTFLTKKVNLNGMDKKTDKRTDK